MARIKVTGFIDLDDSKIDAQHPSGVTSEAFEELHSRFAFMLEEFDTELASA